jgi:hypothetical protein
LPDSLSKVPAITTKVAKYQKQERFKAKRHGRPQKAKEQKPKLKLKFTGPKGSFIM